MRKFRVLGCALLTIVMCPALQSQTAQHIIERVLAVASENGILALSGNTLTFFSEGNIRIKSSVDTHWRLVHKNDDSYSVRVDRNGWQELDSPLPLSSASGFSLCDSLNQVNLGSKESGVRAALPPGARIKAISQISSDLSIALYSMSASAVRYDLRVGVVQNSRHVLIQTELVGEDGNACGMQQGKGGVLFIFIDEPAGSSDFSSVYIYSLSKRQ